MPPKSRWKEVGGPLLLICLRKTERLLPFWAFYRFTWLYAQFRTLLSWRPARQDQPAAGGLGGPALANRRTTAQEHLNQVLLFLPDRLRSDRWLKRCPVLGLDTLQEARRRGPVILVFSHFGPFYLTGLWLRAHGISATTLGAGDGQDRSRTKRLNDRYQPFSDVPRVVHLDKLRYVTRLLASGTAVLVAIDVEYGRLAEIPVSGKSLRIATGAIRLAARYGAELFPCNIVDEGSWRFRIELGEPVPREYLGQEPDLISAGSHLINQLLPCCRRHPEQLEAYSPLAALPGCTVL